MKDQISAAFAIAGVNLRRMIGDPRFVLVATILPIALIFTTGAINSGVSVPLGVVNQARGSGAARLLTLLEHDADIHVRKEATVASMTDQILRGNVVSGVIIPPNFGQGGSLDLTFLGQLDLSQATVARTAVAGTLNLFSAERNAEKIAGDYGSARPNLTVESLTNHALSQNKQLGSTSLSPYAYVALGDLVLFSAMTLLLVSAGVVDTRRLGMLKRTRVAPVRPITMVAGNMASLFVMGTIQASGLVILGRIVFGVNWGDLLALGIIMGFFILAFSALAVLFGVIARSHEQAIALAVIVAIAGGMLGGCFWTLADVGGAVKTIGHLVPQQWAVAGLNALVFDRSGIGGVFPDILALAIFSILLCALVVIALRSKLRSGKI